MRCKYCRSRIHVKDEVCKGCSAPVPTVNYPAGWALFFVIVSLVFSVLGAVNVVFLLLTMFSFLLAFRKARKRNGKGTKAAVWSVIFWILAIVATGIAVFSYQLYYVECLAFAEEVLGSLPLAVETREEYWALIQKWFDYMSLNFLFV